MRIRSLVSLSIVGGGGDAHTGPVDGLHRGVELADILHSQSAFGFDPLFGFTALLFRVGISR